MMVFEHLEEKEAVKIASLIEKNGHAFYLHLADMAEDGAVKDILKRLSREEKRHGKILEEKFYPEAGFLDLITDEEIDVEEHIKKTTDPKIFTLNIDMMRLVHAINSVKKAIHLAVHAERYAAEYFETLGEKASTTEGKRIYKELADEERRHAGELEELLDLK